MIDLKGRLIMSMTQPFLEWLLWFWPWWCHSDVTWVLKQKTRVRNCWHRVGRFLQSPWRVLMLSACIVGSVGSIVIWSLTHIGGTKIQGSPASAVPLLTFVLWKWAETAVLSFSRGVEVLHSRSLWGSLWGAFVWVSPRIICWGSPPPENEVSVSVIMQ